MSVRETYVARPAHNHTMATPWCHVSLPPQGSSLCSAWLKKPHRQGRDLVKQQQTAFRTTTPRPHVCVARPAHNHTMATPWCHVSLPRQDSPLGSAWLKKPHKQGRDLVKQQKAAFRTTTPRPHVCVARPIRETRTQSHNGKPVVARLTTTTGLVIVLSLAKEAAQTRPRPRQPAKSGILNSTPPPTCLCRETRTQSHNSKPVVARLTTTTGLVIRLSLAKEAAQTRPRPCQTTKSGILNNSPRLYACVARPAHNHTMVNPWWHVSLPRQDSSLCSTWLKRHRIGLECRPLGGLRRTACGLRIGSLGLYLKGDKFTWTQWTESKNRSTATRSLFI